MLAALLISCICKDTKRNDISTNACALQGLQVVLYGDDFVESWRGTAGGKPSTACAGIPDVWQRHFGGVWRARAYGIAGARLRSLLVIPAHRTDSVDLVHIACLAQGRPGRSITASKGWDQFWERHSHGIGFQISCATITS